VCDDTISDTAAQVSCRQLGYKNGYLIEANIVDDGMDNIWLDEVNCAGNESMLDNCPHANLGQHNCGHSDDIGVGCDASDGTSQQGATAGIQLVGMMGTTDS